MTTTITRRDFAITGAATIGALAAAGTSASAQENKKTYAPFDVPSGTKQFTYENIINNDALRMDMPLGIINGENDGPTMIVTGGLFATEYCGVEAASRLYRDTDPSKLSGRLIIIPVITYDAFQFRTPMFNLSSGVSPRDGKSLNSVFPGNKDGSPTEVLAHYVFNDLILKSDYHIDLRGGDLAESHVVHSIHPNNASDKVNRISEEMSRMCGYEYFQARDVDERSLVYEASQAGVPSIITQCGLGYKTQPEEEFINFHIQAVVNNMKHFGMLVGDPVIHPKQREFTVEFDRVRATTSGIFQGYADQGDILKKGQLI
ncbi:succinylglutamate desuccinylase/aspartoacylase family protein, partial [Emcibacteraceae bacterium Y4]